MVQFYPEIPDDPKLIQWVKDQQLFHVASAPLKGTFPIYYLCFSVQPRAVNLTRLLITGGHVNVSPKGQPTFKLVNRKAVWYLDLTGSGKHPLYARLTNFSQTSTGNETISHMYEPGNGRMTILFEAFEGPPRILRLFGRGQCLSRCTATNYSPNPARSIGRVIERNTPEFDRLMSGEKPEGAEFDYPTPEMQPGARAIIWLDIEKIGTSCGYAVPFMKFEGHRE